MVNTSMIAEKQIPSRAPCFENSASQLCGVPTLNGIMAVAFTARKLRVSGLYAEKCLTSETSRTAGAPPY